MAVRLHVNVDHVATLRQARGVDYPDPVEAAVLCEHAGADGITAHLREDRRHIQDRDVEVLRRTVKSLLNLEMAATAEMRDIALAIRPDKVTLVPEKREERTTEGGLDVRGQRAALEPLIAALRDAAVGVSLFIDPEGDQVRAARDAGADEIELHTGDYANARGGRATTRELDRLAEAARTAAREASHLAVAAGHGLTVRNTRPLVARVPELVELNIGHALVSEAVYVGMDAVVRRFRDAIAAGEAERGR
ncbi:MAG: pyridoxine 5'-phosphate synthase [Myxococcota bacterium]